MSNTEETLLARLFTEGRSQNGWLSDPVSDEQLHAAYEIAKFGPTSMNTQPMRILFLRSTEAKEQLKPAMAPTNVNKVVTAPVVAVIAFDAEFYLQLPRVFPHNPNAQNMFIANSALADATAFRNGSLQAAYFMLALRAVGLDVGPMSGFDPDFVNKTFFQNSAWRVNLLCGIGHGDYSRVLVRLPRLQFDEVCQTL